MCRKMIEIKIHVYKKEKRARQKLNAILEQEKNYHSDFKTNPTLKYWKNYDRWTVTQMYVIPDKRR